MTQSDFLELRKLGVCWLRVIKSDGSTWWHATSEWSYMWFEDKDRFIPFTLNKGFWNYYLEYCKLDRVMSWTQEVVADRFNANVADVVWQRPKAY